MIISLKIWNVKNIIIFEDHLRDLNSISLQILSLEKEFDKRKELVEKTIVMKGI